MEKYYYRSESPFATIKLITTSFYLISALFICSFFIDFIPSRFWQRFGAYISTPISLACILAIYWGFFTKRLKLQPDTSKWKNALIIIFSPAFIFFMIWISLTYSFPGIATKVLGSKHEIVLNLKKSKSYSRNSCRHRLVGQSIKWPGHSYICITESEYRKIQSGNQNFKLAGAKTFMGFYISSVSTAENR